MNRLDHDEASLHVDADADLLYDLVSDVTRTPEWSPEVISCAWLGGVDRAVVGARFTARNRRRWFTWSNRPVVEITDRGRQFAITRAEPGGGEIRWSYRLEPDAAGTTVTLSYDVLRPVTAGLHLMLRLLFGVRDLRADLHQNMQTSLRRLAEVARREAAGRPSQAQAGGPAQARD